MARYIDAENILEYLSLNKSAIKDEFINAIFKNLPENVIAGNEDDLLKLCAEIMTLFTNVVKTEPTVDFMKVDFSKQELETLKYIIMVYPVDKMVPYTMVKELLKKIENATPVVHAHWIEGAVIEFIFRKYRCSRCGRIVSTDDFNTNVYELYPYCHCGAKMDEEVKK